MDETLSYFLYQPPKSNSHGHGVRDKNLNRAVKKTVDAFGEIMEINPSGDLMVTLYYVCTDEKEKKLADNTIALVNQDFGLPIREYLNTGLPGLRLHGKIGIRAFLTHW